MLKLILTCLAEYCAGLLIALLLVAVLVVGMQLTYYA